MDLSVVNQVMADGEALMNLASISKGQSSYNIPSLVSRINELSKAANTANSISDSAV